MVLAIWVNFLVHSFCCMAWKYHWPCSLRAAWANSDVVLWWCPPAECHVLSGTPPGPTQTTQLSQLTDFTDLFVCLWIIIWNGSTWVTLNRSVFVLLIFTLLSFLGHTMAPYVLSYKQINRWQCLHGCFFVWMFIGPLQITVMHNCLYFQLRASLF